MTLDGTLNRPNVPEEDDEELNQVAHFEANQDVIHAAEALVDLGEDIRQRDGEEGLQIDLNTGNIPNFNPAINDLHQALNTIQQEIQGLAIRQANATTAGEEDTAEEENVDLDGEYAVIDKNLNELDEALTKLDTENEALQGKLRDLLEAIRANNNNNQEEE